MYETSACEYATQKIFYIASERSSLIQYASGPDSVYPQIMWLFFKILIDDEESDLYKSFLLNICNASVCIGQGIYSSKDGLRNLMNFSLIK